MAAALAVALAAGAAWLPATGHAQHTKLSLESIGPAGGNGGQSAELVGAPGDGKRSFIRTAEPLVSSDSDSSHDVYERTGGGTTLVSTGPTGGNGAFPVNFGAAVEAGQAVIFQTEERLTAADTDDSLDVYRRAGTVTTLMSTGPAGGNAPLDSYLAAADEGGTHVFFTTREALVGADTDSSIDIYERSGGTTTLVSTGPGGGNGDPGAELMDISSDGQTAFFETPESLIASDTDTMKDVYARSGGTTTLVSTGPTGGNGSLPATFSAASADGSRVFFTTDEPLVAADTDGSQDVYERSGGTTIIHSIGSTGGNGGPRASFVGSSETGSRVFIQTTERLNSVADRDGVLDVYESTGSGPATLLTPGANDGGGAAHAYFVDASADGTRVLVRTEESIAAPDSDGHQDIYMREAGVLTLLSTGPAGGGGAVNAHFAGASHDATRVFIQTVEALVAADTDSSNDVYEMYGGVTSLLSSGPTGGNGAYDATFRGVSPDGTRVFFRTAEALMSTDTDLTPDVYAANVPGTVTVQLNSMPDHAQDFSFTAIGLEQGSFNFGPLGFGPTTFSLDDDLDPALGNQEVFGQVTPGVGYSVSQTVPAGWDLTAATCDDGSPVGNIEVDAGEEVSCTFTDQKRGRVVVVVDAVPNDAQDFSFTAGGGLSPASFSLDDDSDGTLSNTRTLNDVPAGAGYSLSQSLPTGWDQGSATCSDGSPIGNISVGPDETVTCTFTNNKRGQIVVVKDAQPDSAQDFSFTAGGGLSPASFSLDDDSDGTLSNTHTFANVAPGSGYSLSEAATAGWSQSSAICSDGSPVTNISVSIDEIVTCTFVNDQRGRIVVVKDAQPDDPQNFSFTAGGGLSPSSFLLDDDTDPGLSNTRSFDDLTPRAGYSLSELAPSGWDQSSATCDDGSPVSNISVSPAETVTCTFVNKRRGQIVVVLDAIPNDPQDFDYTAGGGLSPSSFQLDDHSSPTLPNTITFTNVAARAGYSISQATTAGWGLASATCNDGSPVSNIDVGPNETVTCTFVNQQHGSLSIVKDAQPDDAQDFSFSVGGGLAPSSFQLDDDTNGTLSNTRTYTNVAVGTYSVSETVPAGWDQAGATCNDGSPVSTIDIGAGESVTCTFTNQKRGRIVAVLDTQPNDAQDFSFTAGGGLSPTSFSLDDDSDPALSNTRSFDGVPVAGGYSLGAAVPAAWALGGAVCDDGSTVSNINVAPGEVVTCTFTIQKRGEIAIVKDATPNDPQNFSFTAGGGLAPASFQLDDDSDGTLSNTNTFSGVAPGSGYSVSETVPSGWDQTSATCDDGSPVSNINLAPAEVVTCTFSNRKRGQIVIVKDATPDDPQDFSFTAGGGLSPTSFELDDDANATLSNTRTFDVVQGGGYTIAESVPAGWDQTSATCDDGSPISNIDVAAGETVTCTFANRKRAQLVIVKDAVPDDPQDFSFTAGGGLSPTGFQLDDDANAALSHTRTFQDVVPGTGYSISETVPSGWDQQSASCSDGSPTSNVSLSAGEVVTCIFTNRKRGQIVVVKDALPDDPQDFSFTAGGGLTPSSFQLDDDADGTLSNTRTFADVLPGTGYSLSETVPSGWDQTAATCDDGSPVSNVAVAPGETVTCTFQNDKRGQISVTKDAIPDDPQDFAFTAGGGLSPATFSLDDDLDPTLSDTRVFENVSAGSGYSVSETVPGGWDQTSAICDDGSPASNISLSAGEHVSCTFTNARRGRIVVVKDAVPNDAQDFAFTAGGGLSPASFALDDDSDGTLSNSRTFVNVVPGNGYSLSETVPSGWDQASATCDDGSPVSDIDVAPGEVVTCTFTNHKRGRIVAVKDATPNDPQDFSFTTGGGLSPSSFDLDDDSDGTLPNSRTFPDLAPGAGYSLSETVPSGWDQTAATCNDGSPVSDIDVAPGEVVTCTFENSKRGSLVVVEDAVPNDAQNFSFTTGGGLSPASFSLDDDADGTLSNTRTFENLVPGAGYSVSQAPPAGWDLDSATCDDGSPLSGISISAGETVTCTFVHHRHGSVTAVKQAQPNHPQDFAFTAGGGLSPTAFSLDDDSDPTLSNTRTFADVSPQSGYSLAETVPSGWDQTAATCDDGSPVSNIDVAPGEHVTCTFTNRLRGAIVVVQDSQPNDPQDFSFTAGGDLSPASFQLDDDSDGTLSNTRTFTNVPATNGYSVAQSLPSGWLLAGASCDDGSPVSNIDVSPGETVTCTFQNSKRGQIVVVKDATPSDPQDFSFTAGGGLPPSSFALDDDADGTLSNTRTFNDVTPGSGYSVSESVPSGWEQTGATCDDGSDPSSIDVSAGEVVMCTFSNRKLGRIVVVKDAVPNEPQDFSFTAGGGLSPSSFALDDDADGTLSNTQTFDDVTPGSGYSVSESVPGGWSQVSATCSDGSPTSNVGVSAGETVTCTFVNTRGYPRPGGASPLRASMVVAYANCASPNRTHGPALEFPSCNPPAQTSARLTVGTPDANSRAATMVGSVRFGVMAGNPGTPADEADVLIETRVTDVRLTAGLGDYTGELEGRVSLRITDRLNGAGQNEGATVTDTPFSFAVPCTATSGTGNVGATCSLNTTADAVVPGLVVETKRTIWQMGDVELRDGGPDGLASTQDNTRFARQGIFVP